MAEEFIIPIDIDTASLEGHLRRINELIDQIGATRTSGGEAAIGVAEIRNLENALQLAERLQAELSKSSGGKFGIDVDQLQAVTTQVAALQSQLTSLRAELSKPYQTGLFNEGQQRVAEPLVLQPTPGSPAVAPAPTSVQPGLVFAENRDLALQATPDGTEAKTATEAKRRRRQKILSELDQQAESATEEAAVEEGSLLSQKELSAAIRQARKAAKDAAVALAAGLQGELSELELTGISKPPVGGARVQARSGDRQGADIFIPNKTQIPGGEYDFYSQLSAAEKKRFENAGFLARAGQGQAPDLAFERILNSQQLAPGQTPEEFLLQRWRAVIDAKANANVNVAKTGVGLNENDLATHLEAAGLAQNQITPELLRAVGGEGSATSVAKQLLEQNVLPPPVFPVLPPEPTGYELAQQRAAEVRARRLEEQQRIAAVSPEVATIEALQLPEPPPPPQARAAPVAAPVDKTLEQATEAEKSLVFAIRKKVEALDAQTKATNEASSAERSLARAAAKAANAKNDQADRLVKELFPTQTAEKNSALDLAAARRALIEDARRQSRQGPDELNDPKPLSGKAKVKQLADERLAATRESADVQETLARDETGKYAKSVARIRVAYERSAGNIAEELLERNKLTDATRNYAAQAARAQNLQAQLNVSVQRALASMDSYVQALAESRILKAQESAKIQQILAGSDEYIAAQAQLANASRVTAAEVKNQKLQGVGLENTPLGQAVQGPNLTDDERRAAALKALNVQEGTNAALEQTQKAERENTAIKQRQVLANERIERGLLTQSQLEAETTTLTKIYNDQQKKLVAEQQRAAYNTLAADDPRRGSRFQQFQSGIASRDGSFRDPNEFLTGGQFLQSRFLTTAGFAVSGIATYAAFAGIQKMLTDGNALEKILQQIRGELTALGDAKGFESFRSGILNISRDTGEAAQNVAALALQFKGAFGGQFSDTEILGQVRSAVELARVTGISLQEIQNSLTGAAVTYGTTVDHIGDVVLTLQDRTGVAAKESISALSAMAVEAQDVGLSVEEATSLVAVAAKYSGQSGDSIAEGLNRIFPNIQTKAGQIISLFQQADPSKVPGVINALGSGNLGGVLNALGADFNKFLPGQRDYLTSLVGSSRNAKILTDVLVHYNEVQDNVNAAQDSAGRRAKAYADLQNTLSQQLAKVVTALKDIAAGLLQSGLSTVLQDVAKTVGGIVTVFGQAVSVLAAFNSALKGIPAYAGLAFVALKALAALGGEGGLLSGLAGVSLIGGGRTAVGAGATGTSAFEHGVSTIDRAGTAVVVSGGKDVFGIGGGIQSLSQKISVEGAAASTRIGKARNLLGNALQGFGSLFESAGPLIAILGSIEIISGLLDNSSAKATRAAETSFFEFLGGKGAPTGPDQGKTVAKSALDQRIAQYEHDSRHDFSISLNPATDVTRAKDLILGRGPKSASDIQADAVQQSTTRSFAKVLETSGFSSDDIDSILKKAQAGGLDAPVNAKELQKIADRGTTDDRKFDIVLKAFVAAAELRKKRGQDTKGLSAAYEKLQHPDKVQAEAALNAAQELQDLPNLQIGLEIGTVSSSDFIRQATDLVNNQTIVVKQLIATPGQGADTIAAAKQALDQATQARDKAVADLQKQVQASYQDLAQITSGGNAQQQNAAKIRSDLAALQAPQALSDPTTVAASANIAKELVKAQQDQQVYLSQHSGNIANIYAILNQQQKIDPAALAAFNASALQNLPDDLKTNLQEIESRLRPDDSINQAIQFLVTAKGGIRKAIEDQIAQLQQALLALPTGSPDFVKIENEIGALQTIKAHYLPSPTFNAAGTVAGPSDTEIRDAANAVARARVSQNPVGLAQESINEATKSIAADNKHLADALLGQKNAKTKDEQQNAANEIAQARVALQNDSATFITANQQLNDAQAAILQAKGQLLLAQAGNDPVKQAAAQIAIANQQIAAAQAKGDTAGVISGQAGLVQGQTAAQQAQVDIATAQAGVAQALANFAGTPIQAAQAAVDAANVQAANAQGAAAKLNALSAQINAQKSLRDAFNALADSQESVVLAMLNAAGNTVGAANETLRHDREVLSRYLAQHPGANATNDQFVNDQTAKIASGVAGARDALLQKQEDDIQFALDTNKISQGQAIVKLQNLLATANITDAERKQIEREIYNLKQQITKDLQFNLPNDLKLPTLYEARRLTADQKTGAGYQDNRVITITISSTKIDATEAVNKITDAINAPPRIGVRSKSY